MKWMIVIICELIWLYKELVLCIKRILINGVSFFFGINGNWEIWDGSKLLLRIVYWMIWWKRFKKWNWKWKESI